MKVFLINQEIVHSPETVCMLLEKRIMLIWNYKITSIVQKVIFKSMVAPYEVVPNGNMYIIYFSNAVLLGLVRSGDGLFDFDRYLKEVENFLIWKF